MPFPTDYGPQSDDNSDSLLRKIHMLVWHVLRGTSASSSGVPVVLSGASRAASCSAAVASASTTAGVKSVTFLASADFAGTVLGQTFAAGASLTFTAPTGDTLGAMAFTRSAGTLYIYYVT